MECAAFVVVQEMNGIKYNRLGETEKVSSKSGVTHSRNHYNCEYLEEEASDDDKMVICEDIEGNYEIIVSFVWHLSLLNVFCLAY
jgi:hypothetical protein